MVRDYLTALPVDRFPHLVAAAGHFADADADQRFELLLDIFVEGLARHVSVSGPNRGRATRSR
jgi:hypothetical protein